MKKKLLDVSELALNLSQLTRHYQQQEETEQFEEPAPSPETQLMGMIIEMAEIPESKFSWELSLKNELALDSLDMVELVMICERDFEISIGDREWQLLTTAEDVREMVMSRISP